jgi:hypothetical protein
MPTADHTAGSRCLKHLEICFQRMKAVAQLHDAAIDPHLILVAGLHVIW